MYINPIRSYIPKRAKLYLLYIKGKNLFKGKEEISIWRQEDIAINVLATENL